MFGKTDSDSVYRKGLNEPRVPWDVNDLRGSKTALGRIMRAMVMCHATMTDLWVPDNAGLGLQFNSVYLRVQVPESQRERFEALAGCKLVVPPRPNIGVVAVATQPPEAGDAANTD